MALLLSNITDEPDLTRVIARRHRDTLNLLRVDWPQGIDFLQRARGYFGDGLVDRDQARSVVLLEVEQALRAYRRHIGWDDRQRLEAFINAFLTGLTTRVVGLRVEAPAECWEPGRSMSLPEFQLRYTDVGLVVTRADTADVSTLAAALGAHFLPGSLRRALRWCSGGESRRPEEGGN